MKVELPFEDRVEAGRLLGAELAVRRFGVHPLVLALPRGGVPVGAEVAGALGGLLDVLVARKLGVPWHGELAMGAIAGKAHVVDYRLVREFGISDAELEAVIARESEEMKRRERAYRAGRPAPEMEGKVVILVDDGLATGSTMVAAAREVRSRKPAELVVAVPVGSEDACGWLLNEADTVVCLAMPEPFLAVGQWYADFRQVSDEEVKEILSRPVSQLDLPGARR